MLITSQRSLVESLLQQVDYSAPLYQIVLRLLGCHAASPEWLLRLPAFVAGILCVAAAWWLARMLFGPIVAGLTGAFVAINPMQVAISYQARPYTFYVLFSILSIAFIARLVRYGGGVNVAGYSLSSVLLLYSHYYGVFCIAAGGTFAVLSLILDPSSRARVRPLIISFGLVGVASLPACWLALRFVAAGTPATEGLPLATVGRCLNDLGVVFSARDYAILLLVPCLAAVWPTETTFDRGAVSSVSPPQSALASWWTRRWPAILLVVWCAFGIGVPLVLDRFFFHGGMSGLRYLVPMLVPALILTIAFIDRLGRAALFLAVPVLAVLQFTSEYRAEWSNTGMRSLVEHLNTAPNLPPKILVSERAYAPDYVNPEVVGLQYYGFSRRPTEVLRIGWNTKTGRRKLPDDLQIENPELLMDQPLPWIVSFSGWQAVEEYLRDQNIPLSKMTYGTVHLFRPVVSELPPSSGVPKRETSNQ